MPWLQLEIRGKKRSGQEELCAIKIRDLGNGHESNEILISTQHLKSCMSDLKWYYEEFLCSNVFSEDPAVRVATELDDIAKSFMNNITPHIEHLIANCDMNNDELPCVMLQISGNGTTDSLHLIPWELLERPWLWPMNRRFDSIMVVRSMCVYQENELVSREFREAKSKPFNILLLTSRPQYEIDVPYTFISKEIWTASTKPEINKINAKVHFARPGTWDSFKKSLLAFPMGYFSLVHFDMHGEVRKTSTSSSANLYFTRSDFADRKPDKKSAAKVAEKLRQRGVLYAVLNACSTACIEDSLYENLAATFIASGLEATVAMSYKASAHLGAIFLHAFYEVLLQGDQDLPNYAAIGRSALRRFRLRRARFEMYATCDDDGVPVCYISPKFQFRHQSSTPVPIKDTQSARQEPEIKMAEELESDAVPSLVSSLDINVINLESILPESPVLIVTGGPGSGLSFLARHVASWWKDTGLFSQVTYLEGETSLKEWIDATSTKDLEETTKVSSSDDDPNQTRRLSSASSQDSLVIVDDCVFYNSEQASLMNLNLNESLLFHLNEILRNCTKPSERILIFSRSSEAHVNRIYPGIYTYPVAVRTLGEALEDTKLEINHSLQSQKNLWNAGVPEELIQFFDNNILFARIILPRILQLNLHLEQFVPLVQTFTMNDSSATFLNQSDLESIPSFSKFHRCATKLLETQPLAFRILLSFVPFRKSFPFGFTRLWMYKLWEAGAFEPEYPFTYALQEGEIFSVTSDQPEFRYFDTGHPWPAAFTLVKHVLEAHGLLSRAPILDDQLSCWELHPLLPYYLHFEIQAQFVNGPDTMLKKINEAFQKLWVVISIAVQSILVSKPQKAVTLIRELEKHEANIWTALWLSLPVKTINVGFLFLSFLVARVRDLANQRLSDVRCRSWVILLDRVLVEHRRIAKGPGIVHNLKRVIEINEEMFNQINEETLIQIKEAMLSVARMRINLSVSEIDVFRVAKLTLEAFDLEFEHWDTRQKQMMHEFLIRSETAKKSCKRKFNLVTTFSFTSGTSLGTSIDMSPNVVELSKLLCAEPLVSSQWVPELWSSEKALIVIAIRAVLLTNLLNTETRSIANAAINSYKYEPQKMSPATQEYMPYYSSLMEAISLAVNEGLIENDKLGISAYLTFIANDPGAILNADGVLASSTISGTFRMGEQRHYSPEKLLDHYDIALKSKNIYIQYHCLRSLLEDDSIHDDDYETVTNYFVLLQRLRRRLLFNQAWTEEEVRLDTIGDIRSILACMKDVDYLAPEARRKKAMKIAEDLTSLGLTCIRQMTSEGVGVLKAYILSFRGRMAWYLFEKGVGDAWGSSWFYYILMLNRLRYDKQQTFISEVQRGDEAILSLLGIMAKAKITDAKEGAEGKYLERMKTLLFRGVTRCNQWTRQQFDEYVENTERWLENRDTESPTTLTTEFLLETQQIMLDAEAQSLSFKHWYQNLWKLWKIKPYSWQIREDEL